MKKFLCVILAIGVVFSSGLCFISYADDCKVNKISAEEFANELGGLMNAYEDSVGLPGNENNYSDSSDESESHSGRTGRAG